MCLNTAGSLVQGREISISQACQGLLEQIDWIKKTKQKTLGWSLMQGLLRDIFIPLLLSGMVFQGILKGGSSDYR